MLSQEARTREGARFSQTLLVIFGDQKVAGRGMHDARGLEILCDPPRSERHGTRPLSDFVRCVPTSEAVSLLRRLNALPANDGRPYQDIVEERGVRPWWFHQQIAFDQFLVPFCRYQPLLERFASAGEIVIHGCPADLRMILPLVPLPPIRLRPQGDSTIGKMLRQTVSAAYFRAMTALSLALSLARRPELLVYGIDAADEKGRHPWLAGLFDALQARGRSFLEVVWSPGGAHAVRRLVRRRAAIMHLQAVTGLPPRHTARAEQGSRTFDLRSPLHPASGRPSNLTAESGEPYLPDLESGFLRNVAERVMIPRARWSLRAIRRLERSLAILRPQGMMAMDDAVHGFELLAACRRRGVPTVAVQHGQIDPARVGLFAYGYEGPPLFADRYCVWSDHFRKILTSGSALFDADSIVVTGMPRSGGQKDAEGEWIDGETPSAPSRGSHSDTASRGRAARDSSSTRTELRRVLFLAEQYDPVTLRREVAPYLAELWSAFPGLRIRPHPAQPDARALIDAVAEAGSLDDDFVTRGRPSRRATAPGLAPGSLDEALLAAEVVVGSYSSVLFEAVAALRPVVLFATSTHADPHGLAAAGIAELARDPRELVGAVRRALRRGEDELRCRQDLLWPVGRQDGGAAALDVLGALIAERSGVGRTGRTGRTERQQFGAI